MDIYGQLAEKTKALLKNKKYRIRIIISLVLLLFLGCRIVYNYTKTTLFFKKHPGGEMRWNLPSEAMFLSMADNFLGKGVEAKINVISTGDHFWAIANKNEVNIDTIIGCNPYIKGPDARIGNKIISVNKIGVLHYIQENEDLNILSKIYGVKRSSIVKNNHLGLFHSFKKGEILFIPNAQPKVFTEEMHKIMTKRRIFVNPAEGGYAGRYFGVIMHPILKKKTFHRGIDLHASYGSAIVAAADGTVTGGGQNCGGYGKLIIISHTNGYETYYAHCSRICVRIGQKVKQREFIGRVGDTGMATSAHLHFEIHKNGKPVNPGGYLW